MICILEEQLHIRFHFRINDGSSGGTFIDKCHHYNQMSIDKIVEYY